MPFGEDYACGQCFPGGSDGKESVCKAGDPWFDPWFRKIPWRKEWRPTPVFLPGELHGQRSLKGYSPRGRKELDTAEATDAHTRTWTSGRGYDELSGGSVKSLLRVNI